MTFKALYIPVKGAVEIRKYKDFNSLREVVGGEILQFIPAFEGQMVFDEEGKFKSRQMNAAATAIMNGRLLRGDFIVGVALMVGNPDQDGTPTDVPQSVVDIYGGFYNE